jgi:hypothetical protein
MKLLQYKVVTHNLSTRCVHNRLVTTLSTSCNNVVISSSCYKVVTHNLSTRRVRSRLVTTLSTSCNNVVISSSCYKVVTHNLSTRCARTKLVCSKLACQQVVTMLLFYQVATRVTQNFELVQEMCLQQACSKLVNKL